MEKRILGKTAVEALAVRFPQLYVAPADDALEAYKLASARGIAPDGANLAHFAGDAEDALRVVETPAGLVEVLFLKKREDFETFLRIIGHKAQPVDIAPTVGAITYRGLADWAAVRQAHANYIADGGDDWASEFKRLAAIPGTFRAELIVISDGPYSNVPAAQTPYEEDEWLRVSRQIRLHHECAHVVCRRTMPDDVLPVWDEVTADVVGLLGATGSYGARLAAIFLGVSAEGFMQGRLSEYLDEEQQGRIDEIAAEVFLSLGRIEELAETEGAGSRPFDFLLDLKRTPLIRY